MKKIKLPRDDILKAEQYRTENTVGANKGLSTYIEICSLKKAGFSTVKNTSQFFFYFFYLFTMQLFSADPTIFSKQFILIFYT